MNSPKIRIIAGPNGSGKSTLFEYLRENFTISIGQYLNADNVEKALKETGRLNFSDWAIQTDESALREFVSTHALVSRLSSDPIRILDNTLIANPDAVGGYFAAVLCDFIRKSWLGAGKSFTFETVMSGADKLDLLESARTRGYRVYLYFVSTDDPEINRRRVAFRVSEGGHDVPSDKIVSRYRSSLANLPEAIRLCNRAYLFDNSGSTLRFIAEFTEGKLVGVSENPPQWFIRSGLAGTERDTAW